MAIRRPIDTPVKFLCDFCEPTGHCLHAYFDCPAHPSEPVTGLGPIGSTIKIRKPKGYTTRLDHKRLDPFILGAIVAASLVAGFGVGLVANGWLNLPTATPTATPIVSTIARPPGSWRFQPQPDMTPAEATASIALMFNGPDFMAALGPRIEAMPPEIRRHWLAPVTNGQEPVK